MSRPGGFWLHWAWQSYWRWKFTSSLNHIEDKILTTEEKPTVPRPSVADRLAERAFRAAVFGLAFLPGQLYSLWLLVRVVVSRRKMRRKGWIQSGAAIDLSENLKASLWLPLNLVKCSLGKSQSPRDLGTQKESLSRIEEKEEKAVRAYFFFS